MAIYHFSAQIISRKQGRSSVASASYRAGEKLHDERTDLTFDYTKKRGIEHKEILAPSNSPEWISDRQKLWNEVEKVEKRSDAQLSREINIALPRELNLENQIKLTKEFVNDNFVNKGMVADISIHSTKSDNPHAHIMLTLRELDEDGFGKKNREWNKKDLLEQWRESWAEYANRALEKENINERIDHRTLEAQGIERVPQLHLGPTANAMENRGIETYKGNANREIKQLNKELEEFNKTKVVELNKYKELKLELEESRKSNDYLTIEEKQILSKVGRNMGEEVNYYNLIDSSKELNKTRKDVTERIYDIDKKEKELKTKVSNIEFALENMSKLEKELENMPKNIFGRYKDKDRADSLSNNIDQYRQVLVNEAYKDENKYKEELETISKEKNDINKKLDDINKKLDLVNKGFEVLNNNDDRKFSQKLESEFKDTKYLKPDEIRVIREVSNNFNMDNPVNEIKNKYIEKSGELEKVNNQLSDMRNLKNDIDTAKRNLDIVNKYQGIADKWDNKIFGKEKFREKYSKEYDQYDAAKKCLYDIGINNKQELDNKEQVLNSFNKDNLVEDKKQLEREVDVVRPAYNAITRAENFEEVQKQRAFEKELREVREEEMEFRRYRVDFRER